jgi:NACHT domain
LKTALTAEIAQTYSSIQKWLSPAEVQDDLMRHESDCMNGSCDWALAIPGVQLFLNSKENEVLRIGGAPGSGKSTLTAFIIRHITDKALGDVVYFFCKGTDEKRQRPFQVLRTLISQLLFKQESLYSLLETPYSHTAQKNVESFASLQQFFQLILRNTSRTPLYVVVDALDECHEGSLLISFLVNSLKITKGTVRLLLTCRDDTDLLDAFGQRYHELVISPSHVLIPVQYYVQNQVSQSKYLRGTELGLLVHAQVTRAADGSWLYARLMMDEIKRLPSAASVHRQLQNIPSGLAHLYVQIFTTMEKNLSPLEFRLSQQVFIWIDLSDFVSVGRVFLDRDLLNLIFQAEAGEEVFDSIGLAQQLCFPLVRLYEESLGAIRVEFVHHTAAQFVRECSRKRISDLPKILQPQALKELYRGKTGVWYFESCPKSTALLEKLRINPANAIDRAKEYFEMAYGLWDAFFLEALPEGLEEDQIAKISGMCDTLTDFLLSGRCLVWIEIAIIINYEGSFVNLFDNVIKALRAAEKWTKSSISALEKFSMARKRFFTDYAYVIYHTGPSPGDKVPIPDGFIERSLAAKLMVLGKRWSHLHLNRFPPGR